MCVLGNILSVNNCSSNLVNIVLVISISSSSEELDLYVRSVSPSMWHSNTSTNDNNRYYTFIPINIKTMYPELFIWLHSGQRCQNTKNTIIIHGILCKVQTCDVRLLMTRLVYYIHVPTPIILHVALCCIFCIQHG